MYRRILVPLDGSQRSQKALPVAVEMARRFECPLLLMVAFNLGQSLFVGRDDTMPTDYKRLKEHQREQIGSYLKAQVEDLAAQGLEVSSLVREDHPVDAILQAAEKNEVDLIIMTSHGNRGWKRWISGSVAEGVLRRAPCPVLVLRRAGPVKE